MADFADMLKRFTDAVEANDGPGLAALFAEDGVYNDYLYGPFQGREAIARMLNEHFWGDATDFRWDMIEPVSNGNVGYARYIFSFTSTMPAYPDRRVVLEGTAIFHIGADGLFTNYHETPQGAAAMVQLGVDPERMANRSRKWAKELLSRPETDRHRHP